MGKWSVADIMKQYGNVGSFLLFRRDFGSFASECTDSHFHQMQRSEAMLKSGVICSRINEVSYTKLFDISQPLEPGMFNEVKYKIARDAYESINRVINNFAFINQICQLGNFNLQK